jgi:uncharacterized protein
MSIMDHLIAVSICFISPLLSYWDFKKRLKDVENGKAYNRIKEYSYTMAIMWSICALTFITWQVQGYELSALGLVYKMNLASWIIVGIGSFLTVIFMIESKKMRGASKEQTSETYEHFGDLIQILPHTKHELKLFYGTSITAGVVEEIMYFGFLLWYMSQLMPFWGAVVFSVLFFGFAHIYQGMQNVIKVTAISAVLMTVYLLTDSLLLPIILHALFDMSQGKLAYDVIRKQSKFKKEVLEVS